MLPANHPRIGYVVKRYPRHSETFIVNEILAHERADLSIDIFALAHRSIPIFRIPSRGSVPR